MAGTPQPEPPLRCPPGRPGEHFSPGLLSLRAQAGAAGTGQAALAAAAEGRASPAPQRAPRGGLWGANRGWNAARAKPRVGRAPPAAGVSRRFGAAPVRSGGRGPSLGPARRGGRGSKSAGRAGRGSRSCQQRPPREPHGSLLGAGASGAESSAREPRMRPLPPGSA